MRTETNLEPSVLVFFQQKILPFYEHLTISHRLFCLRNLSHVCVSDFVFLHHHFYAARKLDASCPNLHSPSGYLYYNQINIFSPKNSSVMKATLDIAQATRAGAHRFILLSFHPIKNLSCIETSSFC